MLRNRDQSNSSGLYYEMAISELQLFVFHGSIEFF